MTASSGASPADLDRVAARALEEVREGMRLGLGTGRAAEALIRALGARVKEGLSVVGVATSERSEALAREVGIRTTTLGEVNALDVAFDGADEVAPDLSLVKGLGGAHLRERVVASEAARFVVLVTPEKLVQKLGERAPIPVEVVPFAIATATRRLLRLATAVRVERRLQRGAAVPLAAQSAAGQPPHAPGLEPSPPWFVTDNGNAILDVSIVATDTPRDIDAAMRAVPGVVDVGFFLGMADLVLVGYPGSVGQLRPPRAHTTARSGTPRP